MDSGTRTPLLPVSPGGEDDPGRPVLDLGSGVVMEFVGGPKPYFWIGTKDEFVASVTADELRAFVKETAE